MDQEVVGLPMLERVADALYTDIDPTAVLYQGPVHKVVQVENEFVLTVPLPFVGKEEVELSQAGDELIVHVGNQKRNIVLPRALVGAETLGAKLENDELRVRFVRSSKAKLK